MLTSSNVTAKTKGQNHGCQRGPQTNWEQAEHFSASYVDAKTTRNQWAVRLNRLENAYTRPLLSAGDFDQ